MTLLQDQLLELSFKAEHAPRGRPTIYKPETSTKEKSRAYKAKLKEDKLQHIAVLDFETDPFDNRTREKVAPFLAVLYADEFEPLVIWDSSSQSLIERLWQFIQELRHSYTIFAHNGGKFDYMFLIHKLRGVVQFKGRGLMSATIQGKYATHTLRDSYHIIPEKLASLKKDEIDYKRMHKDLRDQHRQEIVWYCIHDCEYLLSWVKDFVRKYGMKLTIGQASLCELKKRYTVERLGETADEYLRHYYMGGRVDCFVGRVHLNSSFSLYDVNSMYPFVMATLQHPSGKFFRERRGRPNDKTVFIKLQCKNNRALVAREGFGVTSTIKEGIFLTTIWEYDISRKYNLITDVEIISCIDFDKRSDFSCTILPLYESKQEAGARMRNLEKGSIAYDVAKKDYTFSKLFQNNIYGKFAQNGRLFTKHYITDWNERPEQSWFDSIEYSIDEDTRAKQRHQTNRPIFECEDYAIWEKPSPSKRFYNVATAASITGAARAVLLEAYCKAREPIYCDTDSLICKELRCEIDPLKLGAWKHEMDFDEIIVNGKKLYAAIPSDGSKPVIKCKGTQAFDPIKAPNGLTFEEMECIFHGAHFEKTGSAPTFTRTGKQYYISREISATVD